MEYFAIIDGFPYVWKRILRVDPIMGNNQENLYDMVGTKSYLSSFFYMEFICNEFCMESRREKWEQYFSTSLSYEDFIQNFSRLYCVTNYACLYCFQYQILTRSLVTNKDLFNYKICTDNLCAFCEKAAETIEHLLYECEYVQMFYFWVIRFANEIIPHSNISDDLDSQIILFNTINHDPRHVSNFVFLIAK